MYIVYREHSDAPPDFYGWSKSKAVIKLFLSQRPGNFKVVKASQDDIVNTYGESVEQENMIDYVEIYSKSVGEKVKLFTTKNELYELETSIQRYFRDQCSILNHGGSMIHVQMYTQLDEFYKDALEFIGFIPPEVEDMYDRAYYREASTEEDYIEEEISDAYASSIGPVEPRGNHHECKIVGLDFLSRPYTKVLYSLESFIKAIVRLDKER